MKTSVSLVVLVETAVEVSWVRYRRPTLLYRPPGRDGATPQEDYSDPTREA